MQTEFKNTALLFYGIGGQAAFYMIFISWCLIQCYFWKLCSKTHGFGICRHWLWCVLFGVFFSQLQSQCQQTSSAGINLS